MISNRELYLRLCATSLAIRIDILSIKAILLFCFFDHVIHFRQIRYSIIVGIELKLTAQKITVVRFFYPRQHLLALFQIWVRVFIRYFFDLFPLFNRLFA
jgi:hypothetical protein